MALCKVLITLEIPHIQHLSVEARARNFDVAHFCPRGISHSLKVQIMSFFADFTDISPYRIETDLGHFWIDSCGFRVISNDLDRLFKI